MAPLPQILDAIAQRVFVFGQEQLKIELAAVQRGDSFPVKRVEPIAGNFVGALTQIGLFVRGAQPFAATQAFTGGELTDQKTVQFGRAGERAEILQEFAERIEIERRGVGGIEIFHRGAGMRFGNGDAMVAPFARKRDAAKLPNSCTNGNRLLNSRRFYRVDRPRAGIYSRNHSFTTAVIPPIAMESQQLKLLERKVSDLIQLCEQLDRENRLLKNAANGWQHEREQLIQKTEVARSKVEAMIVRLKTLEQP